MITLGENTLQIIPNLVQDEVTLISAKVEKGPLKGLYFTIQDVKFDEKTDNLQVEFDIDKNNKYNRQDVDELVSDFIQETLMTAIKEFDENGNTNT